MHQFKQDDLVVVLNTDGCPSSIKIGHIYFVETAEATAVRIRYKSAIGTERRCWLICEQVSHNLSLGKMLRRESKNAV